MKEYFKLNLILFLSSSFFIFLYFYFLNNVNSCSTNLSCWDRCKIVHPGTNKIEYYKQNDIFSTCSCYIEDNNRLFFLGLIYLDNDVSFNKKSKDCINLKETF